MAVEVEDDGNFAQIKIAELQLRVCRKTTNRHWIFVLGQVVGYWCIHKYCCYLLQHLTKQQTVDEIISGKGHKADGSSLAVSHCYRVAFVKEEGQWQFYTVILQLRVKEVSGPL